MPIYKYKEGEHSSGFIGIRVAVGGGKKQKQNYFSFRENGFHVSQKKEKALEEKAIKLEDKWQKQSERSSSIYSTGIPGIRMNFIIIKKTVSGEQRNYYTPVFTVSGSNNSKGFCKRFNILLQGYESAWGNAVRYYAINKDLADLSNLLKCLPPVERFMIISKDMLKVGHKVPKRRLPGKKGTDLF